MFNFQGALPKPSDFVGGDEEDRTPDPLRAKQVLSQLSYTPVSEAVDSRLRFPILKVPKNLQNRTRTIFQRTLRFKNLRYYDLFRRTNQVLLRKEVIQPHLPIRLPCYDFTPVINPTFDSAPLAVRLLASGVTDSHGVTGGVYKARERIHRGMLIRDY